MIHPKAKLLFLIPLAIIGAIAIHFVPPARVKASDHIDSPTVAQDRGSDIADMYAFLDPTDNSQVVLIMSTQGFVVSGEHFGMGIFDHNIRYRFEIENTGDAKPDVFVDVMYSKGVGRLTAQTATITLPGGGSFAAQTTIANQEPYPAVPPQPVVTTDPVSNARFYGGVADDPFFLDDTGANRFVASSLMGALNKSLLAERRGRDTYAGFNSMLTVVSVPAALLRGAVGNNVIGINAVTQRRRHQRVGTDGSVTGFGPWVTVDRSGNPLVNNGLIPATRKDEYNGASTEDDARGRFQADIIRDLKLLGTDDAHINMLLDAIQRKGDILRLDLRVQNGGMQGGDNPAGGFGKMGGRRLVDDVVDMTFTLINNGAPLGDLVNANDVPFRNVFPFVADPTQPFQAGVVDDRTRQ